jgi:tripartite-type tricarboxylate transporter receptor subunit TctC
MRNSATLIQYSHSIFRRIVALLIGTVAVTCVTVCWAQNSDRPIRIVVPYPAGGTTDLLARAIGARMSETLGQSVVVENKAGAGGVIGAQQVAKANPDGLTLVFASIASHGIIPALQNPPPYDAVVDFAPITLAAHTPNVLMANPEFPAKTVKELIALAKAEPGKINYGSTSHGGSGHMSEELLELMAGIKMTHVPYKGATPMLIDLMGGQIPVGFDNLPSSMSFIKAGKVKALAITTAKRWPGAPEIPTMAESGVPGYEVSAWFGLLAPAGTPKVVIDTLNRAAVAAIKTPAVEKYFFEQGAEPVGNTPEEFAQFLIAERDKWQKLAKANNIKLN